MIRVTRRKPECSMCCHWAQTGHCKLTHETKASFDHCNEFNESGAYLAPKPRTLTFNQIMGIV